MINNYKLLPVSNDYKKEILTTGFFIKENVNNILLNKVINMTLFSINENEEINFGLDMFYKDFLLEDGQVKNKDFYENLEKSIKKDINEKINKNIANHSPLKIGKNFYSKIKIYGENKYLIFYLTPFKSREIKKYDFSHCGCDRVFEALLKILFASENICSHIEKNGNDIIMKDAMGNFFYETEYSENGYEKVFIPYFHIKNNYLLVNIKENMFLNKDGNSKKIRMPVTLRSPHYSFRIKHSTKTANGTMLNQKKELVNSYDDEGTHEILKSRWYFLLKSTMYLENILKKIDIKFQNDLFIPEYVYNYKFEIPINFNNITMLYYSPYMNMINKNNLKKYRDKISKLSKIFQSNGVMVQEKEVKTLDEVFKMQNERFIFVDPMKLILNINDNQDTDDKNKDDDIEEVSNSFIYELNNNNEYVNCDKESNFISLIIKNLDIQKIFKEKEYSGEHYYNLIELIKKYDFYTQIKIVIFYLNIHNKNHNVFQGIQYKNVNNENVIKKTTNEIKMKNIILEGNLSKYFDMENFEFSDIKVFSKKTQKRGNKSFDFYAGTHIVKDDKKLIIKDKQFAIMDNNSEIFDCDMSTLFDSSHTNHVLLLNNNKVIKIKNNNFTPYSLMIKDYIFTNNNPVFSMDKYGIYPISRFIDNPLKLGSYGTSIDIHDNTYESFSYGLIFPSTGKIVEKTFIKDLDKKERKIGSILQFVKDKELRIFYNNPDQVSRQKGNKVSRIEEIQLFNYVDGTLEQISIQENENIILFYLNSLLFNELVLKSISKKNFFEKINEILILN